MPRVAARFSLLCLLWLPAYTARTQEANVLPNEPSQDEITQLESCREGLLAPGARPEERRRWAELLFTLDARQATDLAAELLTLSSKPDVQQALCEVIAHRARTAPHRLDSGYVEPLVELLGADSEALRSSAARALADFPGVDVPSKLGELAARTDVPVLRRLAAIDTLALRVDRRDAVRELISLLDANVPEITQRAVAALEPASRDTFGGDLELWRTWWARKTELSEEAWLADRLQMHRDRLRQAEREGAVFHAESRRRLTAVNARMGDFQREIFRALAAEEQQQARLADWLDDPLPEVRLVAIAIIRARIADEGQGPSGEVLAALLRLLEEGSDDIRREVLLIVQTLKDPAVVEAVLARLQVEREPATRHAILKAIGRLSSTQAIPALILEIADPDSTPDCVREAAIALGQVAGHSDDSAQHDEAVAALRARYMLLTDSDASLRAALLSAMAGIGNSSFIAEFLGAIDSDDAEILRPAIRGLQAIGDTSRLPRFRTLVADTDPLVRLAAIEALGQLGREEADLESLLTRLNPTIEANEQVREGAWQAFRDLLGNKPVEDRIESAGRLRDTPDLEIRYLAELVEGLSATNGNNAPLETIRDRLGEVLVAQCKHAKAVPHLRELYEMRVNRENENALDAGLRWIEASLHAPAVPGLAGIITELAATTSDESGQARIIDAVASYLDSEDVIADPQRGSDLLTEFQSVPAQALGDAWTRLLQRVAERLEGNATPPPPETSP